MADRIKKKTGVLYIRGLPKPLKDIFKATCARRGDSMQAVIEACIKKYVNDPISMSLKAQQ